MRGEVGVGGRGIDEIPDSLGLGTRAIRTDKLLVLLAIHVTQNFFEVGSAQVRIVLHLSKADPPKGRKMLLTVSLFFFI